MAQIIEGVKHEGVIKISHEFHQSLELWEILCNAINPVCVLENSETFAVWLCESEKLFLPGRYEYTINFTRNKDDSVTATAELFRAIP
jgi:hypothetical protein